MSSLVHLGQIEGETGPWGGRPLFSETSASLSISLPTANVLNDGIDFSFGIGLIDLNARSSHHGPSFSL